MPAEFYQIYCVCFLFTPPFSPGLIDNEKKKKKKSRELLSYELSTNSGRFCLPEMLFETLDPSK
ncbi:hypothetical protein ACKS23_00040 [Histoplasma ohiense]